MATPTSRTSFVRSALRGARGCGDPEADAVVREVARSGSIWHVNGLLAGLLTNAQPLPAKLPAEVRAFLRRTSDLPDWASRPLLARAQAWAQEHLVHIVTALFCAALPTAFGGAEGAEVLFATGRLERDIDRRVNETGSFVLDVLERDGFGPKGCAVRAAQKVRLLHAAVRWHLASRRGFEDVVPINQEDQLGTLFCFSLVTMDAAERLGARLRPADAEAFHHLWCVVGALLGIDQRRIPLRMSDARAMAARVSARQVRSSEAGRELARVLLVAMERHMPGPHLKPLPRLFLHELAGRELCELLAIPEARAADRRFFGALLARGRTQRTMRAAASTVSAFFGRRLIHRLVAAKLDHRRPAFPMPRTPSWNEPP
jgi:uncharacterized protein (DUF2236 family)